MEKNYIQFQELLKADRLPTVLGILVGEPLLAQEAIMTLRSQILGTNHSGLNHDKIQGAQSDLAYVTMCAQTMPFLGTCRFIEVKDSDKLGQEGLDALVSYAQNPSKTSQVVFLFDKDDKKNELLQALKKHQCLFRFDAPTDAQMPQWIIKRAKSEGLVFSLSQAEMLSATIGSDLVLLDSILEKLRLILPEGEVSDGVFKEHVVGAQGYDIFVLVRAITEGNLSHALHLFGQMDKTQEVPLRFLGLLIWQLRKIAHIREAMDKGCSQAEIAQKTGLYSQRLRWMMAVAQKRSLNFHLSRLTRLIFIDLKLKSSKASSWSWLERSLYWLKKP